MMRRFECYRPDPPEGYREQGVANAPDQVQFEGVEFSDGTVVLRWMTDFRSHSVWASMADMLKVHGHPEYGTEIRYLDFELSPGAFISRVECPEHPGETGDH